MIILAWHFCTADRRLGYDDGREIVVGQTLSVKGHLELCKCGLHGSIRARDALRYAPGPIICRTRHGGDILRGDNKLCSSERTVIAMADATDELCAFARWCALSVLHLWDAPDIVRRYLETGDESIRAAAEAAAWDATGVAARVATWDAIWAVAGGAARAAARVATRVAAWDAARDAAEEAQNTELERRLHTLLGTTP